MTETIEPVPAQIDQPCLEPRTSPNTLWCGNIVPRVIGDESWHHVDAGVGQRVRTLEALLADV